LEAAGLNKKAPDRPQARSGAISINAVRVGDTTPADSIADLYDKFRLAEAIVKLDVPSFGII
jgi:hypothetical protein